MTPHRRTICVVSIVEPADLAESLATACGGRLAALELLVAAVAYLQGER